VKRTGEQVSVGTVKFWHAEKGSGAISSGELPAGRDAWAHFSVIDVQGCRSLAAGDNVEFRYHEGQQDSFDFIADWVRPTT
jgi:CspA family cold shock protein